MIHSGLSRLSNYETLVLPSIVMQDNQEALMITYASGSTPGDSMWFVDQNQPKAWRMWVLFLWAD
jgi:hypothetical protein